MYYFVIFWGIAPCRIEGPFADEDAAADYLRDYEPEEREPADCAMVLGPLSGSHVREF